MLVKVETYIYLEVDSHEQANDACHALGALDNVLNQNSFPAGEAVHVEVERYSEVSDEEADEKGLTE